MKEITIQLDDEAHDMLQAHGLLQNIPIADIIAALMPILLKWLGGAKPPA